VLPDLRNPFFPELADVVGNALFEAGYAMLIGYGHDEDRERESLSRFAAEGVDGICWCPFSDRDTPAEIGMSQPIVVIDRPIEGYDTVSSNYRMAGRLLADELRRCGRRRIGLVNGPDGLSISRARRAALIEAMSDCEIVWEVHNPFSVDLEEGTRDLLITQSVDAIVCGNDAIAIGVLRILRDAGVIVPGRTIVMGFDDIPIAELVEPPLTTVRQPLQDIGDKAVELLMQRMAYPNRALERIELDVVLCRRGSTSPISSG
jgi:LacI family transcriptional regulator